MVFYVFNLVVFNSFVASGVIVVSIRSNVEEAIDVADSR